MVETGDNWQRSGHGHGYGQDGAGQGRAGSARAPGCASVTGIQHASRRRLASRRERSDPRGLQGPGTAAAPALCPKTPRLHAYAPTNHRLLSNCSQRRVASHALPRREAEKPLRHSTGGQGGQGDQGAR